MFFPVAQRSKNLSVGEKNDTNSSKVKERHRSGQIALHPLVPVLTTMQSVGTISYAYMLFVLYPSSDGILLLAPTVVREIY